MSEEKIETTMNSLRGKKSDRKRKIEMEEKSRGVGRKRERGRESYPCISRNRAYIC